MKNRELTVVALKVFAIIVIVWGLLSASSFVQLLMYLSSNLERNTHIWPWITGVLSILIVFGFGIALWKLANNIGTKISTYSQEEKIVKIDERFILAALGIFFTVEGLIYIGIACGRAYAELNAPNVVPQEVSIDTIVSMVVRFAETIIGLTLILGSDGWAKILKQLRQAGLKDTESK